MYVGYKSTCNNVVQFSNPFTASGEAQCWRGEINAKVKLRLDCKSKINIFKPKICDGLRKENKQLLFLHYTTVCVYNTNLSLAFETKTFEISPTQLASDLSK